MSATAVAFAVGFFTDDARRHFTRLDGHRLIDHALLLGVVTHLDIPGKGEVLAEGMADKAIVRQDAAQIDMTLEMDAEQVEGFPLVPVGAVPDLSLIHISEPTRRTPIS